MEAWVLDKVSRLNLDASVYVEYALGLLHDEEMDVSERVESVIAIFSGAADGLVAQEVFDSVLDPSKMAQDVEKLLQDAQQDAKQQEDLVLAEKKLKDLQIRETQRQEAEEAAKLEKQKMADRLKNMTREQVVAREQLINEYGFTVLTEFDEEGNVVKIKDTEKVSGDVAPANSNRQRVQQASNAIRDKMKKEYEKKMKLEKDLLAKDKARKDKAKKRTVKKEKQRGCG